MPQRRNPIPQWRGVPWEWNLDAHMNRRLYGPQSPPALRDATVADPYNLDWEQLMSEPADGPADRGNPWTAGEARIHPNLRAPRSSILSRILAQTQGPPPSLRMPSMSSTPSMTPGGPIPIPQQPKMDPTAETMPGVEESEADRLYRMLLSQAMREPRLTERIAAGLTTPSTPIRHKNVASRSFLRGLVGGFKGSQGFGGPGQGALSRAALSGQLRGGAGGITPAQLLNLQYRERADRRAEAAAERQARGLESLLSQREFGQGMQEKQFDVQRREKALDDLRADQQLGISRGHLDVSRAQLSLAREKEARIAQAAQAAQGGLNPRWPELWKREYQSTVQGLLQKLSYDEDYNVDQYMRDLGHLNDVFSERQFRLEGGVSGMSSTAPRKVR